MLAPPQSPGMMELPAGLPWQPSKGPRGGQLALGHQANVQKRGGSGAASPLWIWPQEDKEHILGGLQKSHTPPLIHQERSSGHPSSPPQHHPECLLDGEGGTHKASLGGQASRLLRRAWGLEEGLFPQFKGSSGCGWSS